MAATAARSMHRALTWSQIQPLCAKFTPPDATNGPTNPQSLLRLHGHPESAVRITLFRDNHAWCPYCQKIWLWLVSADA